MSWFTGVCIYLTIWWTVLFSVLPLGAKSYAESGIKVTDGGDPAAPVNPNLKRKFITTSWISAILFALLWATLHFHWVKLPNLPGT